MPTSSDKSLAEMGRAEIERVAREQAEREAIEKHVTVSADQECAQVEAGIETSEWAVTAWARYYWDKAKGWWAGATVKW